jgi:uncharacterized protein (TIGR00725 family)
VTPYVAVCGAGVGDAALLRDAETVGRELGKAGAVVVCGGLGGVMEAACRGARGAGGVTVGLLPGLEREGGNPHLSVAIPTGMGELRNGLIVRACDALIAVGGGFGTLSEIALALKVGRPVVGLGTWGLERDGEAVEAFERAADAVAAVARALALARSGP